jgi:hypothetical protein
MIAITQGQQTTDFFLSKISIPLYDFKAVKEVLG